MENTLTTAEVSKIVFVVAPDVLGGRQWVLAETIEPLQTPPPGNLLVIGAESGDSEQKSRLWLAIVAWIVAFACATVAFVAMLAGNQALVVGFSAAGSVSAIVGIKVWHDEAGEPALPILFDSEGAAALHPTAVCTPDRQPLTGR